MKFHTSFGGALRIGDDIKHTLMFVTYIFIKIPFELRYSLPILCVNEHLEFTVRFTFDDKLFGTHANILKLCRIDLVLKPHS